MSSLLILPFPVIPYLNDPSSSITLPYPLVGRIGFGFVSIGLFVVYIISGFFCLSIYSFGVLRFAVCAVLRCIFVWSTSIYFSDILRFGPIGLLGFWYRFEFSVFFSYIMSILGPTVCSALIALLCCERRHVSWSYYVALFSFTFFHWTRSLFSTCKIVHYVTSFCFAVSVFLFSFVPYPDTRHLHVWLRFWLRLSVTYRCVCHRRGTLGWRGVASPRLQPDPCSTQNGNWITGPAGYMLCAVLSYCLVLLMFCFSCSVSVLCFQLPVFICRVSLLGFAVSYERLSALTLFSGLWDLFFTYFFHFLFHFAVVLLVSSCSRLNDRDDVWAFRGSVSKFPDLGENRHPKAHNFPLLCAFLEWIFHSQIYSNM